MVPVTFFFHASSETTGETNYAVSLRQREAGGASGPQEAAGTNALVVGVQIAVFPIRGLSMAVGIVSRLEAPAGSRQLAATRNRWKMLCTYRAD